jgi:hypothetical protein
MGKQTAISGKTTPISQVDRDSLSLLIEETFQNCPFFPYTFFQGRNLHKWQH